MRLMNHVLCAFLKKFTVVYFDDIIVYRHSLVEYIEHLWLVLKVLRAEKLYVNFRKCTLCIDKLVFFEYVVSVKGIKVDEEKIKAIKK